MPTIAPKAVAAAAAAAPVFLTGWDGDIPLRSDVRLHWQDRARRRQWHRLALEMVLFVIRQRALPPMGFRTALRKGCGAVKPTPKQRLPPWVDPDFAKRQILSERLGSCSRTPLQETIRGKAYAGYALPHWSYLFDSYDPNWTGAPLEFRHPLVDTRLVAFLLSLPAVPWCVDKWILRAAAEPLLPADVRRRPKTPLRGDPVAARLSRMASWEGDAGRFEPEADQFVVRSEVPPLAGCGTVDAVWLHLRPHGMNYWLKGRRRRSWNEGALS